MAAATSNDREVEEVFEEGEAPKQAQTIHRIRANSTIMQLSKILGESINNNSMRSSLALGLGQHVRNESPTGLDAPRHAVGWYNRRLTLLFR